MPGVNDSKQRSAFDVARVLLPWIVVIVLTPITICVAAVIGNRAYVLASALIIAYSMVPFFVQFERRKPQARELVSIAVMIALIVASRAAFAFLPGFKPMAALVMISGIAFGASTGFLCGSLSMLASNFIFGQGPWTMFQMLSYGVCGFVFGMLAEHGIVARKDWSIRQRVLISLGGALFYLCIAGPILDASSIFWIIGSITPESVLTVLAAGLPFNIPQSLATFLTLLLIGNAILSKLERIKVKYGMKFLP